MNLGEVLPGDNGKDKIDVTTDLQAFGLIVTAEPYYAPTHPSNKVVAENIIRQRLKPPTCSCHCTSHTKILDGLRVQECPVSKQ